MPYGWTRFSLDYNHLATNRKTKMEGLWTALSWELPKIHEFRMLSMDCG